MVPSFYGFEGEHGEPVTGTIEEEVTALVEYYRGLTDDPGAILLPIDVLEALDDFADTCRELGATWLLTSDLLNGESHERNLERIREVPPVQRSQVGSGRTLTNRTQVTDPGCPPATERVIRAPFTIHPATTMQ